MVPSTEAPRAPEPPTRLRALRRCTWRWLPLLVGAAGLLATLILWQALERREYRHLQRAVAAAAASVQQELVARLEARVQALVRMAQRWERFGQPSEEMWTFNAEQNLAVFPGYRHIGWVDPTWHIRWLAPRHGNERLLARDLGADPLRRRALETARDQQTAAATPPLPLLQGGTGFVVYVPIFLDGGFAGAISGAFQAQSLFDTLLADLAPGYGVAFQVGEDVLYRRGPVPTPVEARWQQEHGLLFYGVAWHLRVWPRSTVLAQERTVLPTVVLGGGGGLALLLALVVGLMQRTRTLNRTLAQRVSERTLALQQSETALRDSAEQLRAIYEHATVGISQTSLDGRLLRVNRRFCEITGYSEAELLDSRFQAITHPDDLPTNLDLYRRLQVGEFPSYHMEKRYIRPDGRIVWTDLTGAVVCDAAGRPQYGVAVIQDITARKEAEAALRASEERLRLITDHVAGLIAYVDRDERYRFVNAAYERRFGLPREQILGRTICDLRASVYHHLRPYLARGLGGEAVTFENTYEVAGDALALQVAYVPDVQPDGRVAGLYVLITDITAQKQAQAELARLNEQLRQRETALQEANATLEQRVAERTAALRQEMAERQRLERQARQAEHFSLLGRLAAGVSHEIRNPLGAVFLNVDLLAEELAQPSPDHPQAVAETLAEIKSNLARVEDLVQDYLSLVRVSTLQRTVQDLGAALQTWGEEFRREATARGMRYQLVGAEDLGLAAFHANTLHRALLNLVHNALDAMEPGGTLTLAGHGTPTQVQIQVRDTGCGIPAERQQQIFEPLHTTKPGGTGLGLYIVQEIVAAHGGRVTVESVVGQGTTFTLTWPRQVADTVLPPAAVLEHEWRASS